MGGREWIARHIGSEAFEKLATGLAASELQSVLLEIAQRRAKEREPKDLLTQYQRDPFCAPAATDLRESVAIDSHLLAAAEGFDAIELSPVAPLGACSVVGLTDQNRVLTALRTTEVVSDPTNVLALECARRLRTAPQESLHFATSQRVVRAQPVPKLPGYSQHFRIFVLASAGIETKEHAFTVDTVVRHLRTLSLAMERLEQHGYSFGARRIDVLARPERAVIAARIAETLGQGTQVKPLEHAYYSGGIRYQIWATAPNGAEMPLFDGGTFDWVAKLASNRRAVYVASGGGSQLIALQFRANPRA
ncbi:MAG: hypothetical protein ABW133_05645 [Polyangiaceae bacterium]